MGFASRGIQCQIYGYALLLVCLIGVSVVAEQNPEGKKLVLFAGPHRTGSASVRSFFYNHASTAKGSSIVEGLRGWRWPVVPENTVFNGKHPIEPLEALDTLVTQGDNATAQILLSKEIQSTWEESEHGIIIGSVEFDQVGKKKNGLEAMKRMMQLLRIQPKDVVVVVNFRTPRLDQWASLWKQKYKEDRRQKYKKFICEGDTEEQLNFIGNAMNPLKMVKEYRKQSWKVALVDMGGVESAGLDVAHVIACQVLENTQCDDGFVIPLNTTLYHTNEGANATLTSLSANRSSSLEHLFQERDCYYKSSLQHDKGLDILYKESLWRYCYRDQAAIDSYKVLQDPQLILDAIRTQKKCSRNAVTIDSLLYGNYTGEDIDFVDDFSLDEAEDMETILEDPVSPLATAMIVVLAVAAGVYQLHLINLKRDFDRPTKRDELQMRSLLDPEAELERIQQDEDNFESFMEWTQEFRDE